MKLGDYNYGDIYKGHKFQFKKYISINDIDSFARLIGDFNPLHCDDIYAKTTQFKNRVVHGMLIGSLFSTLLGMICPGKKNLYLSQTLNFRKPVYPESELIVKGIIKEKSDSLKILTIGTEIIYKGSIVVNGEAKVKIMGN